MKIIEAAGAAVLRDGPKGRPEVLLVHRPKYDDWSLPKGKIEPGELLPTTAVREVGEEARTLVSLRAPLDRSTRKNGKSSEKHVSWWRGVAVDRPPLPPELPDEDGSDGTPEVDEVSWMSVKRARKRLSYDQDRDVLDQALEQPVTTPLVLVRHAKAINRKDWAGSDAARPLRPRGRVQSRRLMPLLAAYGVEQLYSSPWQRCVGTLQPYSLHTKIPTVRLPILNEDEGSDDPDGVGVAIDRLREETVVRRSPAVICGHRPVLPHMLAALDLPVRPLATAECVVVHLTDTAEVHAVEYHRPRA
jgi:8-oxo-dGTP diphosphatase